MLHCNFKALNLPKLDVLGLNMELGWNITQIFTGSEHNENMKTWLAITWRESGLFPIVLFDGCMSARFWKWKYIKLCMSDNTVKPR